MEDIEVLSFFKSKVVKNYESGKGGSSLGVKKTVSEFLQREIAPLLHYGSSSEYQ